MLYLGSLSSGGWCRGGVWDGFKSIYSYADPVTVRGLDLLLFYQEGRSDSVI